jgi:hypothetical protein
VVNIPDPLKTEVNVLREKQYQKKGICDAIILANLPAVDTDGNPLILNLTFLFLPDINIQIIMCGKYLKKYTSKALAELSKTNMRFKMHFDGFGQNFFQLHTCGLKYLTLRQIIKRLSHPKRSIPQEGIRLTHNDSRNQVQFM